MLLRILTLSLLFSGPAQAANNFQKYLYLAFQKTGTNMKNCTVNFLKLEGDNLTVELVRKVPSLNSFHDRAFLDFLAKANLRTQKTNYGGQAAVIYRSDMSFRGFGPGDQYKWSRYVSTAIVSQQSGKVLEATYKVWFKSGFFGKVNSWDLTCYGY